ncbi:ABC transporter permease subunit [Romboutsia weinsteinii]|uniref:ABC transporter permease subunit n=1 Tax=Romboutsia weinsteinii TaxID=2020949 RepID=A0A371J6X5_9FIRM|nr:ABC transporter permease subunit [Romboutsia weinsteinii]RDY28485.1 ABC transporter permease subunit [Romboutsia weinsteinii]
MFKKDRETKLILLFVVSIFIIFLAIPTTMLLFKSFQSNKSIGLGNYLEILTSEVFIQSLKNSFLVSSCSALITTLIAFLLSYTVNNTNLNENIKKIITAVATLPMLLPTITYGFAIIYSFGKQGLITKILGFQPFELYGFNGLVLGYSIYTLPISFMLINNTFKYIDKRFAVVSKMMGDNSLKTFYITIFRPLVGTLAAVFIQAFFLSFTDFGIPASVGGSFDVVATTLYNHMLGSIPNFNNGAVIAMVMLIPSIIGIAALNYLEKYNFRYNKISKVELKKNNIRDYGLGFVSMIIILGITSIFVVIFVVPFVKSWPYDVTFTMGNFKNILANSNLTVVYANSLKIAIATAIIGTLIAYGAALVTSRSEIDKKYKSIIESIALVTNTIPGMILGIAFLVSFSGTSLQNTFIIIILSNIIHFFSTPYLMMKNSLSKMNRSWETTAMLMGDSWIKTIIRVVTPNVKGTILEVFSYYFINSMVTISAVIFITGARTMVITTKIKELQHYAKFDEIFVLSLLIFFTNLFAKIIFTRLSKMGSRETKKVGKEGNISMKKLVKSFVGLSLSVTMMAGMIGCSSTGGSDEGKVVIYSNADEEAMKAIKNSLDNNGYENKYIIQSLGTSELGGKLIAEGKNIEADLITMSSYYIDTAQEEQGMFKDLSFDYKTLGENPKYYAPITSQEGSIIVNTKVLEEHNLEAPKSIKDLSDKKYEGLISIPDITGSSTGWLLVQDIISEYGEKEGKEILTKIIENVGPHLESSGSAPIKKLRAGEVGVAFGLRHQAVKDKEEGLPIDYRDPIEGNFELTESVAVINKGDNTNPLAMEMAECIIKNGRSEIMKTYPNALYEGEEVDSNKASAYPKKFSEKLTVDLLKKHQEFSESCK